MMTDSSPLLRAVSRTKTFFAVPKNGLRRSSQALVQTADAYEGATGNALWAKARGAQTGERCGNRLADTPQSVLGRLDALLHANATSVGAAMGGLMGEQAAQWGASLGALGALPLHALIGVADLAVEAVRFGAVVVGAAVGLGKGMLAMIRRPETQAHELPRLEEEVVARRPEALRERLRGMSAQARQEFVQRDLGAKLQPLALAAARGDEATVNVLLQAGADAKHRDAVGWTAGDWAHLWGFHIAKLPASGNHQQPPVLPHGAFVGPRPPVWIESIFTHHPEILRWYARDADVNAPVDHPEWSTAALAVLTAPGQSVSTQLLQLQVLLERGLNLNAPLGNGKTALGTAAGLGHASEVELINFLLAHGARRLGDSEPANLGSALASQLGKTRPLPTSLIARLTHLGADFSQDFWWQTVLHNSDAADGVRQLIAHGANVNMPWQQDRLRALHLAARAGQHTVIKPLLEAGADINARDACGWTALLEACHSNDQGRSLHELTALGADVEAADQAGMNVLHHAAWSEHASERLPLLLNLLGDKAGPLLQAQDQSGCTPLHALAKSRDANAWTALSQELIKRGADAHARTASISEAGLQRSYYRGGNLTWPIRIYPGFEKTAAELARP